jgi:hypothetical protein
MQDGLINDGHKIQIRSHAAHNNIIRDLRLAFLATDPKDLATQRRLIREIIKVQKDWCQKRKKAKEIKRKFREIKQKNQLLAANAVASAEDISYLEYERLLAKNVLTNQERDRIHKYTLQQKYGVQVTPELKLRDDKGYYEQLLTHYYLTHESEYFRSRDRQQLYEQLIGGEGKVFLPDLKNYTLKIEVLKALGVLNFLGRERKFNENDPDLMLLKNTVVYYSKPIQRILGINLVRKNENISAVNILGRLLKLLGLKLKKVDEYYQIDSKKLEDGREKIFAVWRQRDELMLTNNKSLGLHIMHGAEVAVRENKFLVSSFQNS